MTPWRVSVIIAILPFLSGCGYTRTPSVAALSAMEMEKLDLAVLQHSDQWSAACDAWAIPVAVRQCKGNGISVEILAEGPSEWVINWAAEMAQDLSHEPGAVDSIRIWSADGTAAAINGSKAPLFGPWPPFTMYQPGAPPYSIISHTDHRLRLIQSIPLRSDLPSSVSCLVELNTSPTLNRAWFASSSYTGIQFCFPTRPIEVPVFPVVPDR